MIMSIEKWVLSSDRSSLCLKKGGSYIGTRATLVSSVWTTERYTLKQNRQPILTMLWSIFHACVKLVSFLSVSSQWSWVWQQSSRMSPRRRCIWRKCLMKFLMLLSTLWISQSTFSRWQVSSSTVSVSALNSFSYREINDVNERFCVCAYVVAMVCFVGSYRHLSGTLHFKKFSDMTASRVFCSRF